MFKYMEPQGIVNIRQSANSELIYQLSMLPSHRSNCMDKIKIYYTHFYGTKRETKLNVMNQDYTLGGCKMIDIIL